MKLEAGKDHFLPNLWYFTFDPIEVDRAEIDFGDGQSTAVFPPRGQVTHQYDKPGVYKVKVRHDSKTLGSVTIEVNE